MIGEILTSKARKIINTIDQLIIENIILRAKTANLKATLRHEKNKRRREKPLFNDLTVKGDMKIMFFSLSKIQRARDRQQKKMQEKDLAQAQKIEEKHQKQLAKEVKQLLIAQRKAGREEQRLQRLKEKAQKQANQAATQEQRQVNQQLRLELIEDKKQEKKRRQESKLKQVVENVVIEAPKEKQGEIRSSRFGRQLKALKQFDL